MTDQELIESLRLWNRNDAADRIEELKRSRKDLEKLSIKLLNEKLHGEWREPLVAELDEAEAKLAKAVEALRKIANYTHIGESGQGVKQHAEARIAIAVLAELEGGK